MKKDLKLLVSSTINKEYVEMSKPKQPSMKNLDPHAWVSMLKGNHTISKNHIVHEFRLRATRDRDGAQKILDTLKNGVLEPKEIGRLQQELKQAAAPAPKKQMKKEGGEGFRRRSAA